MRTELTPRECAEQTIDGTLPYEETWLENARNVLALLTSLDEARRVHRIEQRRSADRLRKALEADRG